MKKRRMRCNNKKGVSMVLAIALVIVLFLTTSSFLSIAMLQQKETGSQLNTRQAYVSAKSALDLSEELIKSNTITDLPSTTGASLYYVLYYDASGNIKVSGPFATAELALKEIERLKGLGFTVVGNSYIKITKKPDGSFDMSAFSSEDKYTPSLDNGRDGDLSMNFEVNKIPITKDVTETLKINVKDPVRPPTVVKGTINDFLVVGAQTNYSLGYCKDTNDWKWQILERDYIKDNQIVFQMNNNAAAGIVQSRFPIVFTNVMRNDTNSNRSEYCAYNQGVYLLGSYTGSEVSPGNMYNDGNQYDSKGNIVGTTGRQNVSYFTNNNVYGVTLECEFLTVYGNMVSRTKEGQKSFELKCSANLRNKYGVVVRFLNDASLNCYNNAGDSVASRSHFYEKGYYWVKNGEDLFSPELFEKIDINDPTDQHYAHYQNVKDLDIYEKMMAGKQLHSAFEQNSLNGDPVTILDKGSNFQKSGNTYSKVERTSAPTDDWAEYSIYCAPNKMPTSTGYYDMYCKEFNFLWHNTKQMVVNNGVKMSIRSDSATIMISPKTDEAESGKQTTIKNEGTGEFWVRPYWGKNTCSLHVENDFQVEYSGGTYTVREGLYEIKYRNGINLFSDEAKQFFAENDGTAPGGGTDAGEDDIGWVDSTGAIKSNISTQNQAGKYIDFIANSGQLANVTYEASSIDCDFSTAPMILTGTSTTFKADNIMIKANAIKGSSLRVDTSSNNTTCEYTDYNGVKTVKTGQVILIRSKLKLYNTSGTLLKELEPGYYFFNTTSPVDLMDVSSWENNYHRVPESDKNVEVTTTKTITIGYKNEVELDEGRYY